MVHRALRTNKRTSRLANGLAQSFVRFHSQNLTVAEYMVTTGKLAHWRELGEVGQYFAGRLAGFSASEIAAERGWSQGQLREIISQSGQELDGYRVHGGSRAK